MEKCKFYRLASPNVKGHLSISFISSAVITQSLPMGQWREWNDVFGGHFFYMLILRHIAGEKDGGSLQTRNIHKKYNL